MHIAHSELLARSIVEDFDNVVFGDFYAGWANLHKLCAFCASSLPKLQGHMTNSKMLTRLFSRLFLQSIKANIVLTLFQHRALT